MIIRLGGSAPLREQMGQVGYNRARQYFDWERKVDRILETSCFCSLGRPQAPPTHPAADKID